MSQVSVFSKVFPLQSYFDDTALHTALKLQAMNELIVEKKVEPHVTGKFVGLHPSSQTPVAVRLLNTKKGSGTAPIFISPGQFLRTEDMKGLEWGIPQGWQGGGAAAIVIAAGEEAFAGWTGQKTEVIYHRVRLPVVADAALAGVTFRRAWPTRFPWPAAQAASAFAIEPTRTVMRLRLDSLAAQADMRVAFKGNDDLDIGSNGTTVATTDLTYFDVSWPPAVVGALAVAYPVIEIAPPRVGGDVATVALIDLAAGALTGAFVDIARYGRI